MSAEDQLIICGGFAEVATAAKPCDNPSGCLAGLRFKFSSAGRGFLPKVGSAALLNSCSGLKIPGSGETLVTGRTAAALATTQRAGNTSACFLNKLETNCSQFIPLYLLCTSILISVVLHGGDALQIALGKNVRSVQLASKSTNLRPGTQKTFGRKKTAPLLASTRSVTETLKHVKSSVARSGGIVLRWSASYGAGG